MTKSTKEPTKEPTKGMQVVTMDRNEIAGQILEPVLHPKVEKVTLRLRGEDSIEMVFNNGIQDTFRRKMFPGDVITFDRQTADSYVRNDPDMWEEVKLNRRSSDG